MTDYRKETVKSDFLVKKIGRIWATVSYSRCFKPGGKEYQLVGMIPLTEVPDARVGDVMSLEVFERCEDTQFGRRRYLSIATKERKAEMERIYRQSEINHWWFFFHKSAEDDRFYYKKAVEKLHELGCHEYDAEIEKVKKRLFIPKWVKAFRESARNGNFYERAVSELHSVGCMDYDKEIESVQHRLHATRTPPFPYIGADLKKVGWQYGAAAFVNSVGQRFCNGDTVYRIEEIPVPVGKFQNDRVPDRAVDAIDISDTEDGQEYLRKCKCKKIESCRAGKAFLLTLKMLREVREKAEICPNWKQVYQVNEPEELPAVFLSEIPSFQNGEALAVAEHQVFLFHRVNSYNVTVFVAERTLRFNELYQEYQECHVDLVSFRWN